MGLFSRVYARLYARVLAVIFLLLRKNVKIGPKVKIYPGAKIDPDIGRIEIGKGCTIHRGAMILAYKGSVVLGENVSVNPYTILYGHGGLNVGNDTRIAAHAVVIPADHKFEGRDQPIYKMGEHRRGITIEDDVWIGAGAKILDGSYVSKGCVIGANSVIKTKTEAYGVYVGCPAKKIKSR